MSKVRIFMADKDFYSQEKGADNVVRIRLPDSDDKKSVHDRLAMTFETCFSEGKSKILLDLKNLQFPTASLIALLVEATSRARRLNGDIKILNLTKSAKANFATFSPTNYLSLESEEKLALKEFGVVVKQADETSEKEQAKDSSETSQKELTLPPTESDISKKSDNPTVDIAEVPFIKELENSLESRNMHSVDTGTKKNELDQGFTSQPSLDKETFQNKDSYQLQKQHFRAKSVAKNLYSICDFVTDYAEKAGFNTKEVGKTKIAVYEAALNVIEHAYHSNPDNWIDVWTDFDGKKLIIEIKDYGYGFEGFSNKRYDVKSAMNKEQTGGFGLYIIRRSMDEIEYKPDAEKGNLLILTKYLE